MNSRDSSTALGINESKSVYLYVRAKMSGIDVSVTLSVTVSASVSVTVSAFLLGHIMQRILQESANRTDWDELLVLFLIVIIMSD